MLQHVSVLNFLLWLNILFSCIYHILFIHLSVDGYLSCFLLWAVMNKAAINVQVSVWTCSHFSWYVCGSRTLGISETKGIPR